MRASSIALAAGPFALLIASCKPDEPVAQHKPVAVPQVRKAVDHTPLPPLAVDRGGATGAPAWVTGFGGLGIDAPRGVALGPGGECYVVGYFDGETDLGPAGKHRAARDPAQSAKPSSDAFVVELDRGGKIGWARTFGAGRDDVANGVAVRGDQVVVVGQFLDQLEIGELKHPSAGSDDLFVAAFDRAGEPQWLWTAGGIDSDGANAVVAAPDGGWLIGGSFSRTAEFQTRSLTSRGGTDAMLIKLAGNGDVEWVRQFGGRYNDTINHLAVDARGNIYVQGVFRDTADWGGKPLVAHGGSDNDIVLAKYDVNGDHVWSQGFGNAFNDVAGGLTVDPAGNITMVGSFDKTISFGPGDTDHRSNGESDAFVARYTTDGTLVWARTYGAEREDIAYGVAADAAGNTVTVGWFQGSVEFADRPLVSKGNKDVFAIKLDPSGGLVWARRWGDRDHDQARAVAVDPSGAAIVVGIFRFTLDLMSPAIESQRTEGDRVPKPDAFVVKLDR
jgi:hypothetical protein